ncbi:MAG: OsmC family protein [bacterium]|uniref:OsmC/Ohr family protein n=2 Tax=Bacteria candidate phyla TaxID=1783234 RepID=A0A117M6S3_UNCT6|nr:MAG: OsmC/Ohr family protein [candidate division TA06 bacterium 32_111]KUK87462.1 MAG: OsmC/Ohr family protein [candidate division TA06 bacterium 34_109]MDI6700384.1 OsmC family protein [bacterium]HAF08201.1 osmotically inducible protein OsmC [candidate division WOR-3 bacterium]HCP16763.1 osmotically inducible protein OsmC [candidate division WOR-3 bacterium]
MTKKVEVEWKEDLRFFSKKGEYEIVMNSSKDEEVMKNNFSPMELLLVSLAGCTGMDVISILKKMRQDVKNFKVTVTGERADEHPKIYTRINIHYHFEGSGIEKDKVERAIELSYNKYCSVSAMLKKSSDMSYTYEIKSI